MSSIALPMNTARYSKTNGYKSGTSFTTVTEMAVFVYLVRACFQSQRIWNLL